MVAEIRLLELFSTLKKYLSMIISLGLIGLILAAGFTFFIATPQYNATTQILVNRTTESAEGMQLTDINTNVQMINTYKDIIKGPVILNEVRENLGTNLSTTELSEKIEITTQENSQVFSLTVKDDSPYESAEIANSVADTFQNEIGNIMNVDNVTIISEAVANTNPVSPNNLLNLVVGLFVGSLVGIGMTFLLEFMDKTVRDERFITETLGWSVLGSVSEMTKDELQAEVKIERPELNSRRAKSRV
ncbi:chain-length determining protein [Carnobacterium viridans]|uniref:Capsular polysaccharide biosynthesis protein CpsC n=1 Tax=Carnobacterium viridans TaxID=174587 RepID=A0A1H0YH08_9LACT|nr:Wzz/FepE/Etk N-terminal domain-containing protein [Carnobacterium viridans]UDE95147.1 chain-length determining protein [Carnobacterium viridans]SDQ14231.1 Capsular polysaccharide biosynthesis protein [Carnobacterium viridans]